MPRQYPDLPFGMEMKPAAVSWAAGRGAAYSSSDITAALADIFALTAEQRGRRLRNGRPAFDNYVDWLLAEMTRQRAHERGSDGRYSLLPAGVEVPDDNVSVPEETAEGTSDQPEPLSHELIPIAAGGDSTLAGAAAEARADCAQPFPEPVVPDVGTVEVADIPDRSPAAPAAPDPVDQAATPSIAPVMPPPESPASAAARGAATGGRSRGSRRLASSLDDLPGVNRQILQLLDLNGIGTVAALADLSSDELVEMAPMKKSRADRMIMAARETWSA